MSVVDTSVVITNRVGLHARPARSFVQVAAQFQARVQVQCKGKSANARSIVSVLKLGAEQGDTLDLHAEGDDAEQAVKALTDLVARKFDEEE